MFSVVAIVLKDICYVADFLFEDVGRGGEAVCPTEFSFEGCRCCFRWLARLRFNDEVRCGGFAVELGGYPSIGETSDFGIEKGE